MWFALEVLDFCVSRLAVNARKSGGSANESAFGFTGDPETGRPSAERELAANRHHGLR
jgi:hypothetical protein